MSGGVGARRAAAFVVVNRPRLTTDLFLGRDPAVYTFGAAWLVHHPSVRIPMVEQTESLTGSLIGFMGQGRGL